MHSRYVYSASLKRNDMNRLEELNEKTNLRETTIMRKFSWQGNKCVCSNNFDNDTISLSMIYFVIKSNYTENDCFMWSWCLNRQKWDKKVLWWIRSNETFANDVDKKLQTFRGEKTMRFVCRSNQLSVNYFALKNYFVTIIRLLLLCKT